MIKTLKDLLLNANTNDYMLGSQNVSTLKEFLTIIHDVVFVLSW